MQEPRIGSQVGQMYGGVVYRQGVLRRVFVLFMSMFLTVISALMAIGVGWPDPIAIGATLATVGFAWMTVAWIRHMRAGTVALRVTRDGFYDHTSLLVTRHMPIRWHDVRGMRLQASGDQLFLTVELHDPATHIRHLGPFARMAVKANVKLGFGPINIVQSHIKGAHPGKSSPSWSPTGLRPAGTPDPVHVTRRA